MARWKRPDIVPQGDENCVAHMLSVMRLALGYKTGVAEGYDTPDRSLDEWETMRLAWDSFPGRHVVFAHSNDHAGLCRLLGEDYLFAFSYMQDGDDSGHCVIGLPSRTDDMIIKWVLAVSVERRWK